MPRITSIQVNACQCISQSLLLPQYHHGTKIHIRYNNHNVYIRTRNTSNNYLTSRKTLVNVLVKRVKGHIGV